MGKGDSGRTMAAASDALRSGRRREEVGSAADICITTVDPLES
jgi:hypothetical protein